MEWIGGRRFKAKLIVEPARALIGMGDESPYPNRLCRIRTAQQSVLKQGSTDPLALMPSIDGQARQNHHWHRAFGGLPLEQALRRDARLDLSDSKRVEANHPFPIRGYENACGAGCLSMPGITMEPVVQRVFSTGETVQIMLATQWLRRGIGHRLLENAWLRVEIAESVGDVRRTVQQLGKLLPS